MAVASRGVRVFNVAVCGAGVVGGGVVELLKRQRALFRAQKFDFVVKTLLCRDTAKARDFAVEPGTVVTADPQAVLGDPSIDIVVEVIGGTGAPAKDLVLGAAAAGKHVVTANKALLAEQVPALRKAFTGRGGKKRARYLGYEAAVAGGIPIIRTLQEGLLPDSIQGVAGIMNGTTNYMLTAMADSGAAYADVLRDAQAAGFAETDPTADVEGHDARNKLVLLAQLAHGVWVPPAKVRTTGITGVSAFDVAAARAVGAGYTIKLLGVAQAFDEPAPAPAADGAAGGAAAAAAASPARPGKRLLDLWVSPALVPCGSPLATTGGALNMIQVDSASLGRTTYLGAGAGRFPTANSVVADMTAIALGTIAPQPFPRPAPERVAQPDGTPGLRLVVSDALKRTFYVRAPARLADLLGVALWRQGRTFTPAIPAGAPAGGSGSGSGASADSEPRALLVPAVSHHELSVLLRRVAHSVAAKAAPSGAAAGDVAAAAEALLKGVAAYPVYQ